MLPTKLDNGGTNPDFTGIYQELGPNVHPPASVGANEGCFIDNFGARTYRLPDSVNTRMCDPQYFTQDFLDDRALNCVTVPMLAAFCAWDGGKLATKEQIDAAWGAGKYPWGDTGSPLGYRFVWATDPMGTLDGRLRSVPGFAVPGPSAVGGGSRLGELQLQLLGRRVEGRLPAGGGLLGQALHGARGRRREVSVEGLLDLRRAARSLSERQLVDGPCGPGGQRLQRHVSEATERG